jgi:alpha-glucosidase
MKKMRKKIKIFLAFLCIAITTIAQDYTILGEIKDYKQQDNSLVFTCDNGKAKLSFLTGGLVRVQMTPYDKFPEDHLHLNENGPYAVVKYDWEGLDYQVSEDFDSGLEGEIYRVEAGNLIVKIRKSPFKIIFCDQYENILVQEKDGINNAGLGYNDSIVYETMNLPDDEHFFGFGAYKNPLDMRGQKMTCFSTELGESNEGGGFPAPFFMSSKGYGIFFNNLDDDVTFEMGTKPGEYSFHGTNGNKEGWHMDYYFIHGPEFSSILQTYIEITGKPILPEKWYFGHIQSKCCDWTDDSIVNIAKRYREMDMPIDIVVIDYQGINTKKFEWADNFDQTGNMYAQLDSMGVKTIMSTALFTNFYDWENYDPTLQESAEDYWQGHLKFINDGNDGWWQDNAERFYKYSGYYTFANGYENHQLFGSLWAKNVVEGMEEEGLYGRPVLSRSGAISGHRYIIPWPGDLFHGIEYLTSDLDFIRGGALAAYPYATVDLGGFADGNPYTDDNVIRRMANLVPFVPISRAHGKRAGAMLPWNLTEKQQDLYRQFLKFRYQLFPYIYSAAIEGHLTGRPMLAPLVFYFQDDVNVYDKDYHFMFGKQLLVVPVTKAETNKWQVYLPKGQWIDYWTNKSYTGPETITIDAPVDDKSGLPLFVKAGGIIPMIEDIAYIHEKPFDKITWDIYPSGKSSYTWYDKKSAHPGHEIKEITIACEDLDKEININIENPDYMNNFMVHLEGQPQKVYINGEKLKKTKTSNQLEENEWCFDKPGLPGGTDTPVLIIKAMRKDKLNVKIVK